MKLPAVFVLFALIVMVKGAWWATAAQPIILSLGAIWGAIDSDVLNVESLLPFISKQSKEGEYTKGVLDNVNVDTLPAHIQKHLDKTVRDIIAKDGFNATEE